jgi:nucleotide-binding universal stress UspA family protein
MTTSLMVGLDGGGSGVRALTHAKKLAKLIGECELVLVYVIEWSPYSFQTAEENDQRHKRREEEIHAAVDRIVNPAVAECEKEGFKVRGIVKHGDVADMLDKTAVAEGADHIIVARSSEGGFVNRLFGTSTATLVMHASVPVTVVG